jgi:heme/copper-type cytochrome/quinol oxidase subunit 3
MTATISDEMLALPAGGDTGVDAEERRATVPLAVLIAGAGVLSLFGALVAAYLGLKAATPAWPPPRITFDNYTATVLTITALMASVTLEWAGYGIRKGFRGQALVGFGLTVLLGVAFLNALYYLIAQFPFGAGDSPYATVVYAMTSVTFLVVLVAVFGVILTGLRAAGHQLTTDNQYLARAAALLWHVAVLGWIAVYYTVYVTK